jgi:hypothetical protein
MTFTREEYLAAATAARNWKPLDPDDEIGYINPYTFQV